MSTELSWQEKMMQANAELDAQERAAAEAWNSGAEGKPDEAQGASLTGKTEGKEGGSSPETVLDLESMVPAEASQSTPSAQEDVGQMRERIAELEAELQRNKSENGRARSLSEKLKEAEAENQTLRERLNEASRVQPYSGRVDEFTPEECDLMSDEMRQAIGARFAALQKQNEGFLAEQEKIKSQLERANKMAQESERMALQKQLAVRFPNLGEIAGSNAWKTFCGEADPITHEQNGVLFKRAVATCDIEAISAVIRNFLSASEMPNGHRETVGVRPEEHFSEGTPAGGGAGKNGTYSVEQVQDFMNGVYSGRINLGNPENARRYREYSVAMDEGRITQ